MNDEWSIIGNIFSSKIRRKILELLSSKPKTPMMLESLTKYHISHISRSLLELRKLELIFCKNPNLFKGKFYDITEKGKYILKKINELDSSEN